MPSPPLLGAVLAGGRSSRMGTDKSALRLANGQSLLDRALDALRPHTAAQIISGRDATDDPAVVCLPDPVAHRGPATGIAVALGEARRCGFAAALVLPVDQPALTADDLTPLVEAWRAGQEKIAAATFDDEHPEPLIAVYPVSYQGELEALAAAADRSLARFLLRSPHHHVRFRAAARINVNTPEDWSAFDAR